MTKQQKAHAKGLKAIKALEDAIDELKALGECPIDGRNGLMNLRSQLGAVLKHRFSPDSDGGRQIS